MRYRPVRRVTGILVAAIFTVTAAACASYQPSRPAQPPASHSMSASAMACQKIQHTLAQAPATLGRLAANPAGAKPALTAFVAKLRKDAAGAGPQVQSAVKTFGTDVRHVLATERAAGPSLSTIVSQLTKAADTVTTACHNAMG